ncbi:hypothetical protein Pcinc_030730, partial [Petrolisthes cinctipes]
HPHLEKLYLFSNKIVNIELAAFSGLNNLSWLLLNNNLLKRLPSTIFRRTPRLLRLQIDSNKFMRLPEGLLDELKIVEQVKLSMNPWHCDCFSLSFTSQVGFIVTPRRSGTVSLNVVALVILEANQSFR